ncbi:hypothetical protein BD779DRAFT_1601461 [Infundibulicybe gibba]|nr:hypothetical protein BD779DRAFT_1601461 [Infundibulicybe gibba]
MISGDSHVRIIAGPGVQELDHAVYITTTSSSTPARPGSFVPTARATGDIPCGPGSYTSTPGATTCLPCPAGKQCSGYGTSNPQSCPPGTFSISGTFACCTCCAGFYVSIWPRFMIRS